MNDIDYNYFVLDGMRHYRLRWRICDCPKYENRMAERAWLIGYCDARSGKSEKEALDHWKRATTPKTPCEIKLDTNSKVM